jgi:hypothetical protein
MLISAVGRIIVVALAVFSVPAWSGQPSTETLAAYRRAVQGIERRGQDHDVRAALNSRSGRSGAAEAILVQRLAAQDVNGHNIRPGGALIHHWWAVMFIDNTRPEDVVAILTDYDHHARIYAPKVTFSKLLTNEVSDTTWCAKHWFAT